MKAANQKQERFVRTMDTVHCGDVRRSIAQMARDEQLAMPPELVEHIVGCPTCKGSLATLMVALVGEQSSDAMSCARCEAAIAAYLELEFDTGRAAAVRAYPQVAQHIWTCANCGELYQLTRATLAARHVGTLPPMPMDQSPRLIRTFTLARAWLSMALPGPLPQLGVARGSDWESVVIFEAMEAGFSATLAACRENSTTWAVSATVTPPADGWVVFSIPPAMRRARLHAGHARVEGIPAVTMEATDGPDVLVQIELDDFAPP
jgi:hypothetical protein